MKSYYTCSECKGKGKLFCHDCKGKGWDVVYITCGPKDEAISIERCDTCKTISDHKAKRLPKAIKELKRHNKRTGFRIIEMPKNSNETEEE
jgi:hypothetical protein